MKLVHFTIWKKPEDKLLGFSIFKIFNHKLPSFFRQFMIFLFDNKLFYTFTLVNNLY